MSCGVSMERYDPGEQDWIVFNNFWTKEVSTNLFLKLNFLVLFDHTFPQRPHTTYFENFNFWGVFRVFLGVFGVYLGSNYFETIYRISAVHRCTFVPIFVFLDIVEHDLSALKTHKISYHLILTSSHLFLPKSGEQYIAQE